MISHSARIKRCDKLNNSYLASCATLHNNRLQLYTSATSRPAPEWNGIIQSAFSVSSDTSGRILLTYPNERRLLARVATRIVSICLEQASLAHDFATVEARRAGCQAFSITPRLQTIHLSAGSAEDMSCYVPVPVTEFIGSALFSTLKTVGTMPDFGTIREVQFSSNQAVPFNLQDLPIHP